MKNKKAAGEVGFAIVGLVLAVILLVLYLTGFLGGFWNSLQKITGFGGGKINVADVVQSCSVACATSSEFDYCTRVRKVVFDTNKNGTKELTCKNLEFQKVGLTCDNLDCSKLYGICINWGGSPALASDCVETSTQGFLALEEETAQGLICCIPKKTCKEFGGEVSEPGNICSLSYYKKVVSDATLMKVLSDWDTLVKENRKCCIKAS